MAASHPTSSKKPLLIFSALGLGLLGLISLGLSPKLRAQALRHSAWVDAQAPRLVTTGQAKLAPAQTELELPGTALPIETANIYAKTSGFVRVYQVDLGDRVHTGQVLLELDAPELESDLRSARARAEESALNQKLSSANAERYRHLADSGVSSKQAADQAEAAANTASASLRTTQAEVARTSTLLDYRTVRAPFDGVITKRNVERGTLVSAGSSSGVTSLFELSRTDTLKIWVDVPQTYAQSVRVGEAATVRFEKLKVQGRIARSAGSLDPSTRTMRLEIQLPGDQGILAGAFVRVGLALHSATPPVLVPANATAPRAEGLFVFVLSAEGRVQRVPVQLGRELGVQVELIGGLQGGEKLVTNPPENLADGELVRIVTPAPAPTSGAPHGKP